MRNLHGPGKRKLISFPFFPPPLLVLGFGQSLPSVFRLPSSLSTLTRPPEP